MITPTRVNVSRIAGKDGRGPLWLYFDSAVLVELAPEVARDTVYQLAEHCGLLVMSATVANEEVE
ncbi:hypothetical protein N4G70_17185 [Streptomyces sp. ASQP_92]|uniref:hypothetical protein n=1 Tax=Streptomyces sp. ASQP_92 TaxID=2979116 RepID=UPI0021BF1926|nr:hypothetical protein [Streptomyces sp. ASQP_92]MCT9090576.1 hypothetical protein [Streptomyces sp. ASQP_92]